MFQRKSQARIEELEKELQSKEDEIKLLQMKLLQKEIRPHFIFNILLSIKQLCVEEPRMAADALQNFSDYLRARINSMASTECVPFEDELRCIRTYVALEKIDPAADFTVEYDIRYEDFNIPLLSVQPMVENAIRHGIVSRGSEGLVRIRSFREEDHVIIEVTDNGRGDDSETTQQVKHRGIGISNTKNRIRLMCGGDVDIVYTGRGTIVRYTIPLGDVALLLRST